MAFKVFNGFKAFFARNEYETVKNTILILLKNATPYLVSLPLTLAEK